MSPAFAPLRLANGLVLPNRLMLAPLTTQQSHADGSLSRADHDWLVRRATGGFGMLLTAAAAVTPESRAFPGQFGLFADGFVPGLRALTRDVRRRGGLPIAQLLHGGGRALPEYGQPVAPSAVRDARALHADELPRLIRFYADAAARAAAAGFVGVQVHAAYGFLLAQFLDPTANRRRDGYGGSLHNRARLLREVLAAIRARTPRTLLSVRLNLADRGLDPDEMLSLARTLLDERRADHLDLVLPPGSLHVLEQLRDLPGLLSVTGGFGTLPEIEEALAAGADLVGIGTAAVLHADLPKQLLADQNWRPRPLPVTRCHLAAQGAAPPLIGYLEGLPGFVEEARAAA